MTRVGILCWDGDAPRGGLGRALVWLADALRAEGLETFMLTSSGRGGHAAFSAGLPLRLQRWIDDRGIQTLLVPAGPGGVFLARRPKRCRVIAVCYHTYAQQARLVPGESWKRVFVPLERRTLKMADAVMYAAPDTAASLRHEYGIVPERMHLLKPVFPLDRWLQESAPKEAGLCVYVGRLEPRKGIDVLHQAWPKVLEHVPGARLVVVGKGSKEAVDRIRGLPAAAYHDSLPEEELRTLIAKASLALCPASLEGFGLFAAEAMAAGTPVLASNAEGLRTLILDAETGRLAPPGEAAAWAESIVSLLRDQVSLDAMGEAARASMASRFSQKDAIREWLSLLEASPRA